MQKIDVRRIVHWTPKLCWESVHVGIKVEGEIFILGACRFVFSGPSLGTNGVTTSTACCRPTSRRQVLELLHAKMRCGLIVMYGLVRSWWWWWRPPRRG